MKYEAKIDFNPGIIQTRSHLAFRKTDGRDPEKKFEMNLAASSQKLILILEQSITSKFIFQKQTALPRGDQLMLWRFSSADGTEADSQNLMTRTGTR